MRATTGSRQSKNSRGSKGTDDRARDSQSCIRDSNAMSPGTGSIGSKDRGRTSNAEKDARVD